MCLSFAVGDVDDGLVAGPVASPAASVEVVRKGARLSRVKGGKMAGNKEMRKGTRRRKRRKIGGSSEEGGDENS